MSDILLTICLTPSQLMALTSIVSDHMTRPDSTQVYIDVSNDKETTPADLIRVLLLAHTRPNDRRRTDLAPEHTDTD